MASRMFLCAVIAALAVTSCAGVNVTVVCNNLITGTTNRYVDLHMCARDCERDFCQCLGGNYAGSACSNIPAAVATPTLFTVGCARTQKCLRSRVWCMNSFAWTHGVTPTPGTTPVPGTPAPPTPQPPTPVPPTPAPPTPPPTPAPPTPPPTPVPTTPVPPTPAPTPVPPPTPQPSTMQPTWAPPSSACVLVARNLQTDLQAISAVTTTYTNSNVENSCKYLLCNDPWAAVTTFAKTCTEATLAPTKVCKKDGQRPNEATVEAEVKLDATGINEAYNLDKRAVYRALVSDMAAFLDVDPHFIQIMKLELGSLIVKYNVYGGTVASLVQAIAALPTAGAFQGLARVINPVTPPTVTVAVTSVGEFEPSHDCRHNSGCVVGIILGCFGFVFIVVALVVVMKMTSEPKKDEETEPANEEEEAKEE